MKNELSVLAMSREVAFSVGSELVSKSDYGMPCTQLDSVFDTLL